MTALGFHVGDRVRFELTGSDGLPLVRYGFVSATDDTTAMVSVLFDGELRSLSVRACDVVLVDVTTVELVLPGREVCDDPRLRSGLIAMWRAEADQAGLAVDALHTVDEHDGRGLRDANDSWMLAELMSGGEQYVVRAVTCPDEPGLVRVRADRMNKWDWLT
jgi:hypothetical protein